MSPLSYMGGCGGAANTLGALLHIPTLIPDRVLAVPACRQYPWVIIRVSTFIYQERGVKFVVMLIPFGFSNVFVVAYNRQARSDHIPSTIEYNYGKRDLRHSLVDASSLKRPMF